MRNGSRTALIGQRNVMRGGFQFVTYAGYAAVRLHCSAHITCLVRGQLTTVATRRRPAWSYPAGSTTQMWS